MSTRTAPPAIRARPRVSSVAPEVWVLAGVVVLGAALRFITLGSQSYWFDEAQASHELSLSFGTMLSKVGAYEPNPPLYFILAWPWAKVFGAGPVALRSLSAVLGTALIPLGYLCGRELISRRAGLLVAAFIAVNPFMIWYSQEAREYMLLAVLCSGSFLLFARAWREPSKRTCVGWAVVSALALATQYFAVFLVAAEAGLLIWRLRSRQIAMLVGTLVVVQAALLPHAIDHASHPAGWIDSFPLSIRIEQVPVAFGMGTLYLSSLVSYGLIGAAVLAGVLIVLLVVGSDASELRGAGLAAVVAAAVILAPLMLAVVGHDYYEARALIPAWTPLAVVVAAACTARRMQLPGLALAALLLAAFVYAGIRVANTAAYQRPDWRGVALALGMGHGPRAIVAYDGTFATAPLALYLSEVSWTGRGQTPQTSQASARVAEVDVVGSSYQTVVRPLPAGARLLTSRTVNGYRVARFLLAPPWRMPPSAIGARAQSLLSPAASSSGVLIQP